MKWYIYIPIIGLFYVNPNLFTTTKFTYYNLYQGIFLLNLILLIGSFIL